MLRPFRKPLVVMTPKSLLRHKDAASPLKDFSEGPFQTVIGEAENVDPAKVRRVVVCSGKVYYDLASARRERQLLDIAILRLEQLYPFPHQRFEETDARYPAAKEFVWCQEEPGNQGAWHRVQHYLLRHMRADQILSYALASVVVVAGGRVLGAARRAAKGLVAAAFRDKIRRRKAASDGEGLGDARRSPRAAAFRVGRRGDAARMAQEGRRACRARRKPDRHRDRQGRARAAGARRGRTGEDPEEFQGYGHIRRGDRHYRYRRQGIDRGCCRFWFRSSRETSSARSREDAATGNARRPKNRRRKRRRHLRDPGLGPRWPGDQGRCARTCRAPEGGSGSGPGRSGRKAGGFPSRRRP
jgi:hypothetical protein